MHGVSAFILAGGQSSRMGSDKALLSLGEQNLLQRMLRTAQQVTPHVFIVGPKIRYEQFGTVIEDLFPGRGPLGGIHAALKATGTDLNLLLSVDMPRMTTEFLHWVTQQASSSPEWIVVPNIAGRLQPLCAVYRKAVAEVAEQALTEKRYKIGQMFAVVPTRIVNEQEIVTAGFSPGIFENINTREEYDQLLRTPFAVAETGEKESR